MLGKPCGVAIVQATGTAREPLEGLLPFSNNEICSEDGAMQAGFGVFAAIGVAEHGVRAGLKERASTTEAPAVLSLNSGGLDTAVVKGLKEREPGDKVNGATSR